VLLGALSRAAYETKAEEEEAEVVEVKTLAAKDGVIVDVALDEEEDDVLAA
jgi:hypothetical protein